MTFVGNESPQNRIRIGLAFLVTGTLFLVWALASWAYRNTLNPEPVTSVAQEDVDRASPAPPSTEKIVRTLPMFLIIGGSLILVFLFGSYFLLRWARAYREAGIRSKRKASPSASVWDMHTVPSPNDARRAGPSGTEERGGDDGIDNAKD